MENNRYKRVKLTELTTNGKGQYGIGAAAVDFSEKLYTYLRITDISDDGKVNKGGLMSVEVSENDVKKYMLRKNDIVFARTGNSTGRSYLYDPKDGKFIFAGFLIKFNLDDKKVNPKYIRYYTLTEQYKGWVNSFASGSTRNNINAKMYGDMEISLPSREEQDYLVKVLEPLDDKIELNNEMNKTLEEMAQAIFKSWFVDFEPFKDGEFEESELGMIPKGWTVKTLKDICQINMGQSPSSETYNDKKDGLPFYQGIKDFTERFPVVTTYCSDPKKVAEKGDILLSVRAPVGSLNIAIESCCIGRGVASIKSKLYGNNFIYYLLKNIKWNRYESGTVFSSIKKSDIQNYKIIVPSMDVIKRFNKLVKPVDNSIYNDSMENIELRQIRDTLLPKLISGEIRL